MKTPSRGEGVGKNRTSWLSLRLGGDPLRGGINAQLSLLRSYADTPIITHCGPMGNLRLVLRRCYLS